MKTYVLILFLLLLQGCATVTRDGVEYYEMNAGPLLFFLLPQTSLNILAGTAVVAGAATGCLKERIHKDGVKELYCD